MGTTLIEDPARGPRKAQGTTLAAPPARGTGTRLAEPSGAAAAPGAAGAAPAAAGDAHSPVVGWLVIVDGPGRGRSIELGYGMNIVGRSPGNRVVLDFGDDQISGDDHFRIAYDGTHRQFHLVPGRGTNLVYVGESPLLAPMALTAGSELAVGSTRLRFVPLCSESWDWGS